LDNIVQGLRHQNPNLFTKDEIKSKHEPIDLKFLGIQVWSIPKQLHKMGHVLGHRTTALLQGVELIELILNEFH
jgi:hypothetical protein